MADDKQQARHPQRHLTADEVIFEPWEGLLNYWTLKIDGLAVGYVSDAHCRLYPLTSRLDPADEAAIKKAVQDHLDIVKITKRLLHGKNNL